MARIKLSLEIFDRIRRYDALTATEEIIKLIQNNYRRRKKTCVK